MGHGAWGMGHGAFVLSHLSFVLSHLSLVIGQLSLVNCHWSTVIGQLSFVLSLDNLGWLRVRTGLKPVARSFTKLTHWARNRVSTKNLG